MTYMRYAFSKHLSEVTSSNPVNSEGFVVRRARFPFSKHLAEVTSVLIVSIEQSLTFFEWVFYFENLHIAKVTSVLILLMQQAMSFFEYSYYYINASSNTLNIFYNTLWSFIDEFFNSHWITARRYKNSQAVLVSHSTDERCDNTSNFIFCKKVEN